MSQDKNVLENQPLTRSMSQRPICPSRPECPMDRYVPQTGHVPVDRSRQSAFLYLELFMSGSGPLTDPNCPPAIPCIPAGVWYRRARRHGNPSFVSPSCRPAVTCLWSCSISCDHDKHRNLVSRAVVICSWTSLLHGEVIMFRYTFPVC